MCPFRILKANLLDRRGHMYFFCHKSERKPKGERKRRFFIGMTGIYLCAVVCFAYGSFMQGIPDHLYVEEGSAISDEFQSFPVSFDMPGEQAVSEKTYCKLFGIIPAKEVTVSVVPKTKLYVSGRIIGIYGKTSGVLVLGTSPVEAVNGLSYTPAENKLTAGDYIISVNHETIEKKEQLIRAVNEAGADTAELGVVRDGEYIEVGVTPVPVDSNKFKIGVWVKDDMAGIGTMTYYSPEKKFGALGHGVGDGESGALLSLSKGSVYETQLTGIAKGQKGKPGELEGMIHYSGSNQLGSVGSNSDLGIFGMLNEDAYDRFSAEDTLYTAGYKQEVTEGPAQIISCLSGESTSYSIEITSVNYEAVDTNRGITFRVTDQSLLDQTGGIVQGMSGSPIIQNGKLIGAVTHVFVNDPAKGYGIFIETMLHADR